MYNTFCLYRDVKLNGTAAFEFEGYFIVDVDAALKPVFVLLKTQQKNRPLLKSTQSKLANLSKKEVSSETTSNHHMYLLECLGI